MPTHGKEQIVTSLRVNPELWKKAKMTAIQCDMTLTEVIEEALKKYIKDKSETEE